MKSGDDVATALEALSAGEIIHLILDETPVDIVLTQDIPFGHKFALHGIGCGEEVLKYGLPIGRTLEPVQSGDWVHVHNCRSERFGFRHEQYGVHA